MCLALVLQRGHCFQVLDLLVLVKRYEGIFCSHSSYGWALVAQAHGLQVKCNEVMVSWLSLFHILRANDTVTQGVRVTIFMFLRPSHTAYLGGETLAAELYMSLPFGLPSRSLT